MKVCVYCNSTNDDNAKKCSKCNASEFRNVCNNCQTVFSSGFCPTCGIRAGETAKICSNCGTKTFSSFCPSCGTSLGMNPGAQKSTSVPAPVNNTIATSPQQQLQVVAPPKQGNGKMIALTIFFPFVCAWIILFNPIYGKGMRIFALVYSAVMSVASISSGTFQVFPFVIAPIIGYGIKLLIDRAKAKKNIRQDI